MTSENPLRCRVRGVPERPQHLTRLARQLAAATGETITKAVAIAVRERLARVTGARTGRSLADELDEIARRCAALPVLDERS